MVQIIVLAAVAFFLFWRLRSVLGSRKEVLVSRDFKFENTHWHGMPIMAANMDGVGTFSMAKV